MIRALIRLLTNHPSLNSFCRASVDIFVDITKVVVESVEDGDESIRSNSPEVDLQRLNIVLSDGREPHKCDREAHTPPIFPFQRLKQSHIYIKTKLIYN